MAPFPYSCDTASDTALSEGREPKAGLLWSRKRPLYLSLTLLNHPACFPWIGRRQVSFSLHLRKMQSVLRCLTSETGWRQRYFPFSSYGQADDWWSETTNSFTGFITLGKTEMQMLEIFSSTRVTASPNFNFLTASSLNCCFFCTSLIVGVDDGIFPARKPNTPFPWLLQTSLLCLTAASQKH